MNEPSAQSGATIPFAQRAGRSLQILVVATGLGAALGTISAAIVLPVIGVTIGPFVGAIIGLLSVLAVSPALYYKSLRKGVAIAYPGAFVVAIGASLIAMGNPLFPMVATSVALGIGLIVAHWTLPIGWPPVPEGHCSRCRYDLRGVDGRRCPECGTTNPVLPWRPRREAWVVGWILLLIAPSAWMLVLTAMSAWPVVHGIYLTDDPADIMRAMRSNEATMQAKATRKLASIDERLILEAAEHHDWRVRGEAARYMFRLGLDEDTKLRALALLAEDSNEWVRQSAAGSLGQLGTPEADAVLQQLASDPSPAVSRSAKRLLEVTRP